MFRYLVREPVVIGIILASTLAMFMLGFGTRGSVYWWVWLGVDMACVLLFVLEATAKIVLRGWRMYWAERWNRFDLTVTVLSLSVIATPFYDARLFVGFPVLRLGRLFRLFRLMRFIPERDRLAQGVVRALKASVGVFLAVGLVNFIFAMGGYVLFQERAPQYFGDPGRACYAMFQIFTVEGWYEIPQAIAARSGDGWAFIAKVYFGFAVLIGGILGLSLGNAVFVDQMVQDNTNVLEGHVLELSSEIHLLREEVRALRLLREADGDGS